MNKVELIEFIERIKVNKPNVFIYTYMHLKGLDEYEALIKSSTKDKKILISQLTDLIIELSIEQANKNNNLRNGHKDFCDAKFIALALQYGLLRGKLSYTEIELIKLFQDFRDGANQFLKYDLKYLVFNDFPINDAIKQVNYFLNDNQLSKPFSDFIKEAIVWRVFEIGMNRPTGGIDLNDSIEKLRALLIKSGEVPEYRLEPIDIGPKVNELFAGIEGNRKPYNLLFGYLPHSSTSRPSEEFSLQIATLFEDIDLENYRRIAHVIFGFILEHKPFKRVRHGIYMGKISVYDEVLFLSKSNQQFIKGLVWTMDKFSDEETILILSKLCQKAFTKIPGKGHVAVSVGNACIWILANTQGISGLGALSRLKFKIRHNGAKKAIDSHLEAGAIKYKVPVEELKEMAVPDFDLIQGKKVISFGDYKLEIFIEGKTVRSQWIKSDGQAMKSVPSTVKNTTLLSNKLKEIRKEIKEMQKVYSAQKQRIDSQFVKDRIWSFSSFQKYYLNHGLVSCIAKNLIWTFSKNEISVEAILLEGKWYSQEHDLIDWIDEETSVKLWHPINANEKSIIAWRQKMIQLEWTQPIKQAYREMYILTDAEVITGMYSNRMAAHILKQYQFSALASLRDWEYSLIAAFEDCKESGICLKYLPSYNITAQFWIDGLTQEENYSDSGIWNYVITDQVKFLNDQGNALELINVPKIVFTEVMRDVDMFVGVCSVGNDPNWLDNNGERQENRNYWESYSFGDLTEFAKTRKIVLENLLPRLTKIKNKVHIEGKYLVVKGDLRIYKIHIGSGNILMEPNDQYLCIVPSRSMEKITERIFIPFEGDKVLSIVLSKAFLLAEDLKITDTSITNQINRN